MLDIFNIDIDLKTTSGCLGLFGGAETDSALPIRLALYPLLRGRDAETRRINRALRNLASDRTALRTAIREETIIYRYFGWIGRSLEPVTRFAGFDWKINMALISSFAARESSVATLGVLFQEGADENITLEERMGRESQTGGRTPPHAFALMLFFALYPPCLAATIMMKAQTGSYRWMLFSIAFPTAFGLAVALSFVKDPAGCAARTLITVEDRRFGDDMGIYPACRDCGCGGVLSLARVVPEKRLLV
jgi:hypothetical protein